MTRTLTPAQAIERSIIKTYRKELWHPFHQAVSTYQLIEPHDRIAVCISGGKDSMLLAKLMQQLHRHTNIPFELVFLAMDPGYQPQNRQLLEDNANLLDIPLTLFTSRIFDVANQTDRNPCYLCARMRRGTLYAKAQELGCNKIALGHHLNDVIETPLLSMLYGGQLQAMPPKLHSTNFPGMQLIRPLYMVREEAIVAWANHNRLTFLQCACRLTEQCVVDDSGRSTSKRQEIKLLIQAVKKHNPDVEKSIFQSIHNVHIDTMPGYKSEGENHSFLERFEKKRNGS